MFVCLLLLLLLLLAGGGFWLSGAYLVTATGLVVRHNHCQNDDELELMGGGGLIQEDAHLTCLGCLFHNNSANLGGGLMVFSHRAAVVLEFTRFTSNSANVGGAVALQNSASSSFTSCEFFGNSATSSAGAVYSTRSLPVVFSFCNFQNCTCSEDLCEGGTLALHDGRATLTSSTIRGGKAGFGGGIFTTKVRVLLDNTEMTNCQAGRQGGAVEVTSFSEIDISHSEVTNCSAGQSGGGIFASATCTVATIDSKFENLTSLANGGVMYLEYNSKCTSYSSTFRFNRAGKLCGVVWCGVV